LQPFSFSNAAFGPEPDAGGRQLLLQQPGQHFTSRRQCQTGELYRQPVAVTIDHQPRQAVRLAEDEPARGCWADQLQDVAPQANGLVKPARTESLIERGSGLPAV